MALSFFDVLITVVCLVLLMIPGYILRKTKLLPDSSDSVISVLVLYGCQPALMIMGFQNTEFSPLIALKMLIVAGLALFVHLIMILLVSVIYRNKDKSAKINCMKFASIFGNVGYMGIPFLQMLFTGRAEFGEIMVYSAVVIAVFNILNWSIGIYLITGDKSYMSARKAVLNPTVIAVIIGLIIFLIAKVPIVDLANDSYYLDKILEAVMKAVKFTSDMITPLAMTVVGIKFANIKFKALFIEKWAYVASFNKLILMSVLTMLAVAFLPVDNAMKYAIFFTLSMPSASSTVLFAVQFGSDGDFASVCVLLTNLLSILTIPLMFLMFSGAFGIIM